MRSFICSLLTNIHFVLISNIIFRNRSIKINTKYQYTGHSEKKGLEIDNQPLIKTFQSVNIIFNLQLIYIVFTLILILATLYIPLIWLNLKFLILFIILYACLRSFLICLHLKFSRQIAIFFGKILFFNEGAIYFALI